MWPIPIQIVGTKRPGHFTFLILYVVSVIFLFNFILPVLLSTKRQKIFNNFIFPATQEEFKEERIHHKSEQAQAQALKLIEIKKVVGISLSTEKNDSTRRSNPTKIWSRRQENHLRNHWIPDMKLILDESKEILFPWINSLDGCQNFSVHFAKKYTFQPIALVSYPGSGNSWVRYLIESITGIFTGSLFNDQSLYNAGLRGEMNSITNGQTIVQKTYHDTAIGQNPLIGQNDQKFISKLKSFVKISQLVFGYRGILLIRNPYDALLSYWNYLKSKDHNGQTLQPNISSVEWKQFVIVGSRKWSSLIRTWIENSQNLLIVQYERLQSNSTKELVKILNYLNQPLDKVRLDCVNKNSEGPFYPHFNNYYYPCKINNITLKSQQDLIDIIQLHINDSNDILRQYNFPILNYNVQNSQHRDIYLCLKN